MGYLKTGYLRVEKEAGLALVYLDQHESRVNTLSVAVLEEFAATLDDLERDPDLKAGIILSAKEDSFVVGADINEFEQMQSPEEARSIVHRGHALLDRLENLRKPVVAAVHGTALGGGLELALACHYRLATDHPVTVFALPEVLLGLLPGLGGTQRLPNAIGVQRALQCILTGRNIHVEQAKSWGLIDATIHRQGLLQAAHRAASGLADGSIRPRRKRLSLRDRVLEGPLERVLYDRAGKTANERSRGNYPAIPKILDCVRTGRREGLEAGLAREAENFAKLLFTPESRAQRHLFFIKSAAEKNPYDGQHRKVGTVGVLGAGLMGTGIAQVSAQRAGNRVFLKDADLALAAKGKGVICGELDRRVGRGMSAFERDAVAERVRVVGEFAPLSAADLVVEAVPEDLGLKREQVAELEAVGREEMLVATNTSAIPVREVAAEAARPERVIGMHYFSPVPKMPLLEIVRTGQNPDWVVATAFQEGLDQGKTVIVVGDSPGFYTTRILAFYINEALLLLEEGATVEAVDSAMMDFGFPVGPLKLLDEVGIDTGAKINAVMADLFAERSVAVSERSGAVVAAGYTGRKSGRGFYLYEGKNRGAVNPRVYEFLGGERRTVAEQQIQDRMSLMMVNEAVRCLEEGVISSPADGDVGAVFGLGFAPFRGGPFWYADQLGAASLVARLNSLRSSRGERFAPAKLLEEYAEQGRTFFGR